MNNGRFNGTHIYAEKDNKIPGNPIKTFREYGSNSYSRTNPNFKITKNYTTETYYYSVEKNTYDYLYVCPSLGEFYSDSSYIEVCNIKKIEMPIGIWIGAGAFVLVVYILIIILYQYKRAPKQKHIDTTVTEPIVINASSSTNTSNQNVIAPSPNPYPQQHQHIIKA